ncbi:MAG: holo-ACP synthase [Nitrospirota bacterium]|nr:holo-ACP synthase [Nitrospirota bacterium]
MVLGVGIDTVSLERFRAAVGRWQDRFTERLFTPEEIEALAGRADPVPSFAARFALKEAVLKALGTGLRDGIAWHDIITGKNDLGKPEVVLTGRAREVMEALGGRRFMVSISHDVHSAVAVAILADE